MILKPKIKRQNGISVLSLQHNKQRCDVFIGSNLIIQIGTKIVKNLALKRAAIITDENVAEHHLHVLIKNLEKKGIQTDTLCLPSGEKNKNFDTISQIVNFLLSHYYERGDGVIALGGGVIGDLVGFAAGITRRGMLFIQVPTSLLAQVDSSIGGKTGINSIHGKNLIGLFYPPRLTLSDTDTLRTLPPREFRAGYAEILKHAVISNSHFFDWLEKNWSDIFSEGAALQKAIEESCLIKATHIINDEYEQGERKLLNFGHTFGHALESAMNNDNEGLLHGEAIAIGMALASRLSERLNLTDHNTVMRIENHLKTVGLPWRLDQIPPPLPSAETLLNFMRQDKKVIHGSITLILIQHIGSALIFKNLPEQDLLAFIKDHHPNYQKKL